MSDRGQATDSAADDDGRATGAGAGAVDAAYADVAGPLGDFVRTIEHTSPPLPGTVLTDPSWLVQRVEDTGRRWSHEDPRVGGTLWWYSASSTLVAAPLMMLLLAGRAPDPRLARLSISLQTNGYLKAARSDRLLPSVAEFADAFHRAYAEVITALAEVSGASPRALWAIATDSIGNRALEAGRAVGDPDGGVELARAVCRPPLLPVRYVDVDGPEHTRRFVRRSSCCLIYVATGGDKCVSCPRRPPDDRRAELLRRTRP